MDHIPISGQVVPGKIIREDYPLYPPLATRKATANAICHRDYTISGGAVAIALYNNRLEVINPGTLHFDMTPEKLAKPHESKPWNPVIASVFYRAGIIEKWGTGTLNIIDWCKKNGNPKPVWEIRSQSLITTFLPSSFFSTGKSPSKIIRKRHVDAKLPSMKDLVFDLLKKGPLSKSEIFKALGHQSVSGGLKKVLNALVKEGHITHTIPEKPRSKSQKYQIKQIEIIKK